MDLNKLRWLLIEVSNDNYSRIKKMNRTDDLGIYLLDRTRLIDQNRRINEMIEALTELEVGSDRFATIKKEG
jgi:hypothetical protein